MNFDTLRKAADIAAYHHITKVADVTPYLVHALNVARKIPGIAVEGFKTMGKGTTEALAMPGEAPGAIAKALGWGVAHAPHAAAIYGGAKLMEPHVMPFVNAKMTELQARMAASQPYYDPETQRYM